MSARSIHFSGPDHYCLHFAKRHRRHSVCNDAYESNNNVNFYVRARAGEATQADTRGLAKMAADLGVSS
jgi:hypothetical protein